MKYIVEVRISPQSALSSIRMSNWLDWHKWKEYKTKQRRDQAFKTLTAKQQKSVPLFEYRAVDKED